MPRELKSAAEIQAEVHNILHSIQEVRDDGVQIGVPHPVMNAPDPEGCNWHMTYFANPRGHTAACRDAVTQVQAKWNMA